MKSLKERIVNNGRALNETVLKVDSFLNHQVDAKLMYEMGTYFKEYFKNHGITRILTIESSGIAPTVMTALQMNLPMVILKKQQSKILNGEVYQTTVHSFTKVMDYELTLSKNYISSDDKFDINVLKELLVKKFETIDYIDAKEDVIPFIKDVHSLDLWNKDFFVSITNDMQ